MKKYFKDFFKSKEELEAEIELEKQE